MATDSTDEQILKGLLDTLVLHVLQAGPNYGFGIREQLDQQFGTDADIIKEATLYPLLHRLERKGLLASHHEPGDRGSPDQRVAEWRRVAALLQRTIFQTE
jgi:PadR family transcriptional regulator, regulatory protein PadR